VLVQRSNTIELVGTTAVFDGPAGAYIYPDLMKRLRFKNSTLALWFWRYANSSAGRTYFVQVAVGSTGSMPKLSGSAVSDMPVPLPPVAECEMVVEVLSDAERFIESLERLIAKKRRIKLGAMQELLPGKRRLPEFEGEWEYRCLRDVLSLRRDRIDPSRAPSEFCVELEHLESGTGRLLGTGRAGPSASQKSVFDESNVLFGKLRAYLKKYWLPDRAGVCSTEIWILAPIAEHLERRYLFQIIQTDAFIEAASTAYGTHMPRSDWSIVGGLEYALPAVDEQRAVASVLSDMDAEIAALEARLSKARQLKRGMMQQLLTGRIRLV
jgi:type I restriction enzyme S subunit